MKRIFFLTVVLFFSVNYFFCDEPKVKFNPWELIIYRPENSQNINDIRCWVKIENSKGEDAFINNIKANYWWVSDSHKMYSYQNKVFLSGGMAAYLNLKPGKYKISVYTEPEDVFGFKNPNPKTWQSNILEYDTENPAKVIFVYPTVNENKFYNGGWHVSYKAPEFFKYTKGIELPVLTQEP